MSGPFICKVSDECTNPWHYLECPNFRATVRVRKRWFWWAVTCKAYQTGQDVTRRSRDLDRAIQKCIPFLAREKPSYKEITVRSSGGKLVWNLGNNND